MATDGELWEALGSPGTGGRPGDRGRVLRKGSGEEPSDPWGVLGTPGGLLGTPGGRLGTPQDSWDPWVALGSPEKPGGALGGPGSRGVKLPGSPVSQNARLIKISSKLVPD